MPISTQHYLLQKPRVGSANSPFTASPDDYAVPSNLSSFGTDESNPGPIDYLTLVLVDGNLADPRVTLGFTKNEGGTQRFTYDGTIGTFKPIQYGRMGELGTTLRILLSPLPGASEFPIVRIGFGLPLQQDVAAPELTLPVPTASGHFNWATDTGLLKFYPADVTSNTGTPVYFDGVLLNNNLKFPRQLLGSFSTSPIAVSPSLPISGNDLVFVAMNGTSVVHQFSEFVIVSSFTTGKLDQVQVLDNGSAIKFYASDAVTYGAYQAWVVIGDVQIDVVHGVSLRFFRSPVNLGGSSTSVKDLTAFYPVTDAKLASPIIGAPMVFLPVLPIDDPINYPFSVSVQQGTGTFVGTLPRLDVPSPPAGIGYTIDFDGKQLNFAQRQNFLNIPLSVPTAAVQLNPGVVSSNAVFSLNGGPPLALGAEAFLDPTAGILTFVSQTGTLITSGVGGSTPSSPTIFVDPSADFSLVQAGYLLVVSTAPYQGVYDILSVLSSTSLTIDASINLGSTGLNYDIRTGPEILADRFFQSVQLVDPNVTLSLVRNSVTTLLTPGKDYRISADLGTFQTTFRLLSLDQLIITYPSSQDNPDPTVTPLTLTTETASFLVRKELTVHPTSTSVIPFNPNGRVVAQNPAPTVFRGGRPQDSSQYTINFTNSTITFLSDVIPTPSGFTKVTDALPHGAIISPNENVYIDYYITQALGGENTVSVIKPNLILIPVQVVDGTSSFTISGDQRSTFPENYLLRIEQSEVYYLASPSYDGLTNLTTVNLLAPQVFRDSSTNPNLFVSTGPLLRSPLQPQYFIPIGSSTQISRGMNNFQLSGDHSGEYVQGTLLYFSNGTLNDFYLVSGSSFDGTSTTTVTITQTTAREYSGSFTFWRSIRPVYEANVKSFQTSGAPAIPVQTPPLTLLDTVLVYRKIVGQPGVILTSPLDFKIDDSGKVDLTNPLLTGESFDILYTKHRVVNPGYLQASYTSTIVPTQINGLLNQILVDSLTTYIPDSFYARVETMTNFRGQLAQKYKLDASSSAPSSGPRVDNASQPQLFEQGNASVYFEEGDLANEDIVARATLKFYNDAINDLEIALRDMDGRVVGDKDGLFKFDGSTGNPASSILTAGNQIDDIVSMAFGDTLRAYQAGTQSRFYPTLATVSQVILQGINTGDPIMNFGVKPITGSSPTFFRRFHRALVTRNAEAGDLILHVDDTTEITDPPIRPAFDTGLLVSVADPTTVYVPDSSPLTVTSVTPTSLGVSALPVSIPAGVTVYLSTTDLAYPPKSYRVGLDVILDTTNGYLLYRTPIPVIGQAPIGGDLLQGTVFFANLSTSPKKFPALYGLTLDDNGDQEYPLVNPSLVCESGLVAPGYLNTEFSYVQSWSTLQAPYTDLGTLNFSRTVLTSNPFPSFLLQPGDLVQIGALSSNFYIINSVGSNFVVVSHSFPGSSSGPFNFLVTVSSNLVGPATTASTSGVVLTDSSAAFISSGTAPGYTVVASQGSTYERRQVLSVESETQLTLDFAFGSNLVPGVNSYRICRPLNTFGGSGLQNAVNGLLTVVPNEVTNLSNFFEVIFTDLVSPTPVAGTFTGGTLSSIASNFTPAMIGGYIYAQQSQPCEGVYKILTVVDANNLTVDGSPSNGSVSFRVVSALGVAEKSLTDLFVVLQESTNFYGTTSSWNTLISPLSVVSDPQAFAQGLTSNTQVQSRYTAVVARQLQVSDSISKVTTTLAMSDRLYDYRYTWIDTRINLETGILVKQQRAIANRIKAQQDILNSMLKLLAVQ
jgi:hypothetical protein